MNILSCSEIENGANSNPLHEHINEMKSVLVISVSDLGRDPRVHRQLVCIAKSYNVTAVGLAKPKVNGVDFIHMVFHRTFVDKIKVALMLLLRRYDAYYWSRDYVASALVKLEGKSFDVIIANDLNTLPLALEISSGKSRVIFDAHEYSPRELEDNFLWRLLFQPYADNYCRKYLSQIDGMMTVCQGIADEYKRSYGVSSVVVTNAPAYRKLEPSLVRDGRVRMIHHGGALPGRHLELMIETMALLDVSFTLDLMLMPSDERYLKRLKVLAAGNANIRFLDPVPMTEISSAINGYDLGIYILKPNNFNNAHALPNKIFEFIQGRLAIAIGPSPEMARLVREYDCGVVAEDFTPQAMAKAISGLTDERIAYYKQQANKAAGELSAENNEQLLLDLIEGR